jgi:hypothetical protein
MVIERPAESRFYTIINKMAADDVNLEARLLICDCIAKTCANYRKT